MVRNVDGSGHFLHNKEGMTQEGPLTMISYGIGILPLIHELHNAHTHITQLWYTNNACTRGSVWCVEGPQEVLSGEGNSARIFTGSYKEHLGRIPAEFSARGVPLPKDGSGGGHSKPLPRRIYW